MVIIKQIPFYAYGRKFIMARQNKPYCKDTLTTVEQNDKSSVKN